MEHLVNMKWFDIPILRTMGKDNLCLYFVSIEQIVAVMPKLIVVASLAIQLLFTFLSQLGELHCHGYSRQPRDYENRLTQQGSQSPHLDSHLG